MRVFRRRLPLWLWALIVVCSVAARPAEAHGVLVGASPAPNSVLNAAPTQIVLLFNEDVDAQLSRVMIVRGASRTALVLRAADGRRLTYNVPSLEPGAYVIDWRVISNIDGHLTRGAFAFGVGADAVPSGVIDTAGRSWPDVAVRWLGLVGVLMTLGTAFAYGWLPRNAATEPRLVGGATRVVTAAAALVIASSLARVWLDAAAIADAGGGLVSVLRALGRVLGASPTGHDALFRMTGAVFMARLLGRRDELSHVSVLIVGVVLLIGPTLTGHGLTVGLGGAALSFAHLAAASVWVGGLVYFGLVYLPAARGDGADAVYAAAVRFSRLALVCVLVLAVTGGAQAGLYAGVPTALGRSIYGRTLIAKLIVIAPLLLLAAVNRWRIMPRITAGVAATGALRTLVRSEAAVALVVVALAAAVATTAPATTAGLTPLGAAAPSLVGGVADDLAITLTVDPPHPGRGRMTITVGSAAQSAGASGGPNTATRYRVRIVSLARDLPPRLVPVETMAVRPGTLSAEGLIFDESGWWAVEVRVRRAGREDAYLWLPVYVDTPGTAARPAQEAGDPQAVRALRRAESETARARTWQEVEHLSDGERSWVTTWYAFARPDRVTYRTSAGSEGRQIGIASYSRAAGQAWALTQKNSPVRVAFRFSLAEGMVDARLGARLEDGGRTVQIVTYQEPSGLLKFAAWIDEATGLPRRVMMHGPGHYMVSSMEGYNEPISITAP